MIRAKYLPEGYARRVTLRASPLSRLRDDQLEQLREAAGRAARRGAHKLGPRSLHAVQIEINRRKAFPHLRRPS